MASHLSEVAFQFISLQSVYLGCCLPFLQKYFVAANILILEFAISSGSLMKKRKNKGPRTGPCETPQTTDRKEDS